MHASHFTRYLTSGLPPKFSGGNQVKITFDWSTKLTDKFCGADGGSAIKFRNQFALQIVPLSTYVCKKCFSGPWALGSIRYCNDTLLNRNQQLWNVPDKIRTCHRQLLICIFPVDKLCKVKSELQTLYPEKFVDCTNILR